MALVLDARGAAPEHLYPRLSFSTSPQSHLNAGTRRRQMRSSEPGAHGSRGVSRQGGGLNRDPTSSRRVSGRSLELPQPTASGPSSAHDVSAPSSSSTRGATSRRTGRMQQQANLTGPTAQGGITYTKNGRISKAKKGVKGAHACACGKAYSRAEHLRRHQQSHQEALNCRQEGCHRTFHREDLRRRHEEKHLHGDMPSSISRSPSISYTTASDVDPAIGPAARGLSHQATTPVFSPASLTSQPATPPVMIAPSWSGRSDQRPVGLGVNTTLSSLSPGGVEMSAESHSSASDYTNAWRYPSELQNPMPVISQPPPLAPSSESWTGPYGQPLISPASASHNPQFWYSTEKSFPPSGSAPMDISYTIETPGMLSTGSESVSPYVPYVTSGWDQPSAGPITPAGMKEPSTSPASVLDSQTLSASLNTHAKQSYTDAFWEYFHPLFPILHKPTVKPTMEQQRQSPQQQLPTSLLLRAAIVMCGATMTREDSRWADGKVLMRKCSQHMEQEQLHPLNDMASMQAFFLIEACAQFHSQRAQHQLSENFLAVVNQLQNDPEVRMIPSGPGLDSAYAEEQQTQQWYNWIRVHAKQRLLLACNVLMTQSSLYLSHDNDLTNVNWQSLYLPASAPLWEAKSMADWRSTLLSEPLPHTITETLEGLQTVQYYPFDEFQSSVLVAAHAHAILRTFTPTSALALTYAISPNPSSQLHLHAVLLTLSAPLKALMAVAGESWTPSGGRLATHARTAAMELSHMKLALRSWVNQAFNQTTAPAPSSRRGSVVQDPMTSDNPVHCAVHHALSIVRIAVQMEEDGGMLPFAGEMPLFAASLVLWAVGFAALSRGAQFASMKPPLSTGMDTANPRHAVKLFLEATGAGLPERLWSSADPKPTFSWRNGVDTIMRWARARIAGGSTPAAPVSGEAVAEGSAAAAARPRSRSQSTPGPQGQTASSQTTFPAAPGPAQWGELSAGAVNVLKRVESRGWVGVWF